MRWLIGFFFTLAVIALFGIDSDAQASVVRYTPVATRVPIYRGGTNTPTSPPGATATYTPTITRTRTTTPTPTKTPTPFPTNTSVLTSTPTPTATSGATTKTVCASGCDYTTISAAAAAISPGYVISVKTGTYAEFVKITQNNVTLTNFGDGAVWITGSCARLYGVQIDADDVTVRGIGVTNVIDAGITVQNAKNRAIIDMNTVQDYNCKNNKNDQFRSGIQIFYGGSGQRITGNTITRRVDLVQAWPGMGNGIYFKGSTANPTGGGHYIADNIILGGFDGIGSEDENDGRGGFDRNTTIERNSIAFCNDDGIQVEGGGLNIVVQDNIIQDCKAGIASAMPYTGPVTIQRNAIFLHQAPDKFFGIPNNGDDVYCLKVGNPFNGPVTSTNKINFLNNRCIADVPSAWPANYDAGKGIEQTNSGLPLMNISGNDLSVSGYVYEFNSGPPGDVARPLPTGSTVNGNCLKTIDPGRFIKYGLTPIAGGNNALYMSIAAFNAATGFEATGQGGPGPNPPACVGLAGAPPLPTRAPTQTLPTNTPTLTGTPFTPTPIVVITQPPTSTTVSGTTREVCASGCTYVNINQAIGAANIGDTINVHAGTYTGGTVTINKNSLTLQGAGDGQVWITGSCARTYGIDVEADDVTIRSIGVKQTISSGIIVQNGHARTNIDQNTIQDWNCRDFGKPTPTVIGDQLDAGISVYYGGPGQRVTNNTLTRRVEAAGSDYGMGDGIFFKSGSNTPSQTSGGGHYIGYNTITGGFDGIGGEVEDDPRGSFDKNTVIEHNVVRNCWDDGIQNEGGGENIYIQYNTISECGIGIALAAAYTGPLYAIGNDITSNTVGYFGTFNDPPGDIKCFKYGNASDAITYLISNTCSVDVPNPHAINGGKGIAQTNSGISGIVTYGNTFNVSGYVFELKDTLASGSSLNFDCMQTLGNNGSFAKYENQAYDTIGAFRSGTLQETFGTTSCGPALTATPSPTRTKTSTAGPSLTPTITLTPTQTRTPTVTATPGGTTFALVHRTTLSNSTSPAAVTIPSTAAGTLLVACVGNPDSRVLASITTSGLTWTLVENVASVISPNVGAALYYAYDAAGGHTSATVTMSGSTIPHIDIGEFSGSATSSIVGNHAHSAITTSSSPGVTWTPNQTGNLLVACGASSGSRGWSPGSGYTKLSSEVNSSPQIGGSEYRLSNPGGAETSPMGLDSSAGWVMVAGEFKVVTNGGGGPEMDFLAGVRQFLDAFFAPIARWP